jgi:nicotinate phosphoribosyltransferase
LALLTDLYELTMAYGYWKAGLERREAVFHLFFRSNPFGGGLAIAAGQALAVDYVQSLRFSAEDAAYLAGLRGNDEGPLFQPAFLDFLQAMVPACDVDGVAEGTVVFPHEPLLRVRGPLIQAQILESALLNIVNFQTLIATKAARVAMAAGGDPVLEFGLRRAQGIDGALSASRAAYIGGCAATSNVLAGRLYGIPVKGTLAHSWVMCFDHELEAFKTYAEAMPNNCLLLVDTYDTLEGVRNAIEAGRMLRGRGQELAGIRLDSGDLARLSIEARRMLDEAGFPDAVIVGSNDLDEHLIAGLKAQGATIGMWGVGTKLATGYDQPALGGVYKLAAIRERGGPWQYKLKLSEQALKVSNPGILQVRRYFQDGQAGADVIFDEQTRPGGDCSFVDPLDAGCRRRIAADTPHEDLLEPLVRAGGSVGAMPSATEARDRAQRQLALFHPAIKRLADPGRYPVGLEAALWERKAELVRRASGTS